MVISALRYVHKRWLEERTGGLGSVLRPEVELPSWYFLQIAATVWRNWVRWWQM